MVSVNPAEAGEGESVYIEIYGENFDSLASVFIGGVELPDYSWTDSSSITGHTPSSLGIGTHNVRVINPNGQYGLLVDGFMITPPATSLSGYVTNAVNAQPIEGAVVTLATISGYNRQ
ncbi:MAG: IPT/TIG domain-containing protein [Candidatus Marinimicrobia bacterium]|nr:IPT/TIG domain-containing protein [Candidatus Neomarinimicrobiota bacterium]